MLCTAATQLKLYGQLLHAFHILLLTIHLDCHYHIKGSFLHFFQYCRKTGLTSWLLTEGPFLLLFVSDLQNCQCHFFSGTYIFPGHKFRLIDTNCQMSLYIMITFVDMLFQTGYNSSHTLLKPTIQIQISHTRSSTSSS